MLCVDGQISSYFLPVKMSRPTRWTYTANYWCVVTKLVTFYILHPLFLSRLIIIIIIFKFVKRCTQSYRGAEGGVNQAASDAMNYRQTLKYPVLVHDQQIIL